MQPSNIALIVGVLSALASLALALVVAPDEQSDKERAELHGDHEVWHKPQLAPLWTAIMDPAKPYLLIANFDERFLVEENTP